MPPRSAPIWSLPTAPRFLRHIPPPRVRKSQDHGGLAAMSTAEFFSIHPSATTTTTSGWTSSRHRPTRADAGVSSIRCSTEAGGQGHRAAVVSGEKLLRDGNLMKCGGGCIVEARHVRKTQGFLQGRHVSFLIAQPYAGIISTDYK